MVFDKKIESEIDDTIKYIFTVDSQIIEFSYIDNGSGKDIICVPCQTMCNLSCKFCHLTDHVGEIPLKDLEQLQILKGVKHIADDLELGSRTLLISYMGCGEPLDNINGVIRSMTYIRNVFDDVRFGLATMLPKKSIGDFFELTQVVKSLDLNLKIHLSLHFTDDELRNEWMPAALNINESMDALSFYHNHTGNPTEIHYTIMDGINDDARSIGRINELLATPSRRDTTVKFMRYSEKESLDVKATAKKLREEHIEYLISLGLTVEYYEPPGLDIGASCGQFLLDYENTGNIT